MVSGKWLRPFGATGGWIGNGFGRGRDLSGSWPGPSRACARAIYHLPFTIYHLPCSMAAQRSSGVRQPASGSAAGAGRRAEAALQTTRAGAGACIRARSLCYKIALIKKESRKNNGLHVKKHFFYNFFKKSVDNKKKHVIYNNVNTVRPWR